MNTHHTRVCLHDNLALDFSPRDPRCMNHVYDVPSSYRMTKTEVDRYLSEHRVAICEKNHKNNTSISVYQRCSQEKEQAELKRFVGADRQIKVALQHKHPNEVIQFANYQAIARAYIERCARGFRDTHEIHLESSDHRSAHHGFLQTETTVGTRVDMPFFKKVQPLHEVSYQNVDLVDVPDGQANPNTYKKTGLTFAEHVDAFDGATVGEHHEAKGRSYFGSAAIFALTALGVVVATTLAALFAPISLGMSLGVGIPIAVAFVGLAFYSVGKAAKEVGAKAYYNQDLADKQRLLNEKEVILGELYDVGLDEIDATELPKTTLPEENPSGRMYPKLPEQSLDSSNYVI